MNRNQENEMNPDIVSLIEAVEDLKLKYEAAETRYNIAQKRYKYETFKLKVTGGIAAVLFVIVLLLSPGTSALAQGYGESLHQLISDVSVLKQKTRFMSVSGTTTAFTGCNVQITNGLGATDGNPNDPGNNNDDAVVNGLGNLIIGYNGFDTTTSGSHNLVIGDGNSYSSYGGIVAGLSNTISAPYTTISGGYGDTASGTNSSIVGGVENTASGAYTTVICGSENTAKGTNSVVTGGVSNLASGELSCITGGEANTASGSGSADVGGTQNAVSGLEAAIIGGEYIKVDTNFGHYP